MRHILLATMTLVCTNCVGCELKSNEVLRELKNQDQAARSTSAGAIDWEKVSAEDGVRRVMVAEMP